MSGLSHFSLRGRPSATQWAALAALTLVFGAALSAARLPAGLLLGAIAAAATVSAFEGQTRVPPRLFIMAQAVIGGMIAQKMTPEILAEMARDWPVFLAAALSVVLVSGAFGWLLTRWRVLPGATAIWGALPGAASAMIVMAEAYGADMRLVAFMQYLRVLLVALIASLIARFAMPGADQAGAAAVAFIAPVDWPRFALTLALLLGAAWLARITKLPAGPLLLPLFAGAAVQDLGWFTLELPRAFLALNYALLGWAVGLRFTRDILRHAVRALPAILGATLALIALCGGLAFVLARLAHLDPMTAYLAMSPGGIDAVAIVAASAKLDMSFVMALQTARVLMVILVGPALARFLSGQMAASSNPGAARPDEAAID